MSIKGKVKSWNLARGFGFVISDKGDNEAFVHTSNIDGGILIEGKPVTYSTKASDRKIKGESKLVAVNLGGEGFRPKSGERGKLKGVVKSWKHGKAMGFIKGDDGEEVYVHASSFGGGCLKEGLPVFYDSEDVKHKSHRKAAINVSGDGVVKGSMSGYVKRWIADRGFGFIEANDGCQVYVHCSAISDGHLVEGKEVYFNITEEQSKSGDKLATRKVGVDLSGPGVKDGPALPTYPPMPVYEGGKGGHHMPPPPHHHHHHHHHHQHHHGGKGGKGTHGKGSKGNQSNYQNYPHYPMQYGHGYYGYGPGYDYGNYYSQGGGGGGGYHAQSGGKGSSSKGGAGPGNSGYQHHPHQHHHHHHHHQGHGGYGHHNGHHGGGHQGGGKGGHKGGKGQNKGKFH
eukprot:TRINITY_DN464_c0_g1_i2.p1 TRINITY_DN464_c0_g1~~TRINITY_DN464_c0_g1_i2.p1  ORF type:complete len:412 (+),score=86.91 TRINITY_DN464_c0_g1_i2:45-1238(+)